MTAIYLFGQQTSLLEIIAMLTGIISVWLTAKKNILCFPAGMINVALYSWLFFSPEIRLYADGLLQVIYFFLLAYGWMNWKKPKKGGSGRRIQFIAQNNYINLIILFVAGSLIMGAFFQYATKASFPYLDSSLTVLSLIAQWMIAKKYIDNWLLWILADVVYIPMYFAKNLPLTSLLYFIFLVLCVVGYRDWKKELNAK